jgi:hypothetical protein
MSGQNVQQGSVWATVKAVAWSFLGVRKGSGFQEDISKLKPYHIIAVGLVGGILFVLFLFGLVNWIVAA